MQRFDNQTNTAPIVSKLSNKLLNIEKSQDDLSRPILFDASFGWIIPFDFFETLPNAEYDISYDILAITRNPAVRRLMNNCKIYVHVYAQDLKHLWEGAPSALIRGKDGKQPVKTIPVTTTQYTNTSNVVMVSHDHSPSTYLGVPARYVGTFDVSDDDILAPVYRSEYRGEELNPSITYNVLPLVMYQQICAYNYLPRNLLLGNDNFFPQDEMHFKLSSSLDTTKPVYNLSYDNAQAISPDTWSGVPADFSNPNCRCSLNALRVRQFKGDPFNTGLPFPDLVRGDIPSINLASSSGTVTIQSGQKIDDAFPLLGHSISGTAAVGGEKASGLNYYINDGAVGLGGADNITLLVANQNNGEQGYSLVLKNDLTGTASVSIASAVTMAQLRSLDILTAWRARNARTDGTYAEIMKAQYGINPDYDVGKPKYIGGCTQDIIFSDVVQTSEGSEASPLGRTSSRGVSAGSGYCGHYFSKDFGYVMAVMSIVPDEFYANEGLDKAWSRLSPDQFYYPVMSSTPPVAMLNKELKVTGNAAVDDDVFAYQEPFYEYRSRKSMATGQLAHRASIDEENAAYVMKRTFDTTPQLSYGFTGMFPSNIDFSVFANTIDTPFIISAKSRVNAWQPLPYAFDDDTVPQL